MKCIKSIKASKNTEIGVIKRISDKEADSEVKSGRWMYIPKSEWRKGKTSEKIESEVVDNQQVKSKKTKKSSK